LQRGRSVSVTSLRHTRLGPSAALARNATPTEGSSWRAMKLTTNASGVVDTSTRAPPAAENGSWAWPTAMSSCDGNGSLAQALNTRRYALPAERATGGGADGGAVGAARSADGAALEGHGQP